MNILMTYYFFLVGGAVVLLVLRDSPLVSKRRSQYVAHLLMAPMFLFVMATKIGLGLNLLVFLVLLFTVDRVMRKFERPVTPTTPRLWLIVWLIEAVLPLSLHFALVTRPDLERIALIVTSVALFAGTLLTFLVLAPDARKKA
jgi:formate-dependent nitrite reductase membrane component NrfD